MLESQGKVLNIFLQTRGNPGFIVVYFNMFVIYVFACTNYFLQMMFCIYHLVFYLLQDQVSHCWRYRGHQAKKRSILCVKYLIYIGFYWAIEPDVLHVKYFPFFDKFMTMYI